MVIECKNCGTRFNVDETRIKETGSKVRCSQCKHVFTIFKPQPESTLEFIPEPAPKVTAPPEEKAPQPAEGFEAPEEGTGEKSAGAEGRSSGKFLFPDLFS